MKSTSLTLLVTAALGMPLAAQAAESPHTFTANVGLTSDYLFRGISQSSNNPAIQGGVDYAHSSGVYLGVWGSNVGWIEDYQGYDSGNIELDFYGGYRGNFGSSDFTFDVGAIQYYYPGDRDGAVNANTTELYAGLGWKWFTVKYSHTVSDGSFGFPNADGSGYIDVTAAVPIGETGVTASAHWGSFTFENNGPADYDDWKVSLTYDMGKLKGKLGETFSGTTLGVAYSDTNAKKAVWTDVNGDHLGDAQAIIWVSKVF